MEMSFYKLRIIKYYKMKEVYIDSKKVQLIGFLFSIPIVLFFVLIFWLKWDECFKHDLKEIKELILFSDNKKINSILIFVIPNFIILIGIIIHELIHGVFMAFFSKNNWKSVRFGLMTKHLIPYANCKEFLTSKQMLLVTLSPFFILGFFPFLYSVIFGNLFFFFISFSMTLGAVGDFIYAYLIITKGLNQMILDHESKIGFKIMN